jgi:hypothetical protein|tara:strand:+ start:1724 stop:2188 length:465 start_codon:yes stop_codon:yes gene_type:complete
MSFTRFYDDPNRIRKQVEESNAVGLYMLNKPGQGIDLPYFEDVQIRLQKWGANLKTNTINLESDLLGITRKNNRDNINLNNYKTNETYSREQTYKNAKPIVDESRATHPAWMYKDLEQTRWEYPYQKQLNNYHINFEHNLQSRMIEKDNYNKKH